MSDFASIGGSILAFNLLIVLHEAGHYLLAKATGMTVHRFSVGIGPPIVQIRGKETVFQVGLFPVGGFVQVKGMNAREDGAFDRDSYLGASLWKRAAMVFAGPAFNWLGAVAIFMGLLLTANMMLQPTPTVSEVKADGPAAAAGLLPGDTIVEIDGTPVDSFEEIREATGASGGAPLQITVIRPPEGVAVPVADLPSDRFVEGTRARGPVPDPAWARHTLEVTPEKSPRGWLIGIVPDQSRFGVESPLQAGTLAWAQTWHITERMVSGLWKVIVGEEEAQLASVVKITEYGADALQTGFQDRFLQFIALLSVNLFLLNLLPVPPLDGGRLVFIGLEAIARRPVPRHIETLVNGVGMVLLLGLIVVVTVGDVASYF